MESLKKRWMLFLDVVLDPWNFLLIIAVFILNYLSGSQPSPTNQTSTLASTLLFILITLASVILGGRITKQWADITEGSIVIARGRSAVRSLKLLLRLVTALEERITEFRMREEEIEKHPLVTKRNYEEAIGSCRQVQEQTVNSIENWTDIIPEADIKTEIGVISELRSNLKAQQTEREQLNNQLQEAKGKSESERTELRKQIIAKELLISELSRDIQNRDLKAGIGSFGLLFDPTAPISTKTFSTSKLSDIFNKSQKGMFSGHTPDVSSKD